MSKKRYYSPIKDYTTIKKPKLFFKFIRFFIRKGYKEVKIIYEQELNHDRPIVYISNHCQIHGPLAFHLTLGKTSRIWCTQEVFFWKTLPEYAFLTFLKGYEKKKSVQWLYRILSYLIAPLLIVVFRGADAIPVYRDARLLTTYKKSAETILEGLDIVIFPECPDPLNDFINVFNPGFVDIARFMKLKAKKEIVFVPCYYAPELRTIKIGSPVEYDYSRKIDEQRKELLTKLQDEVTRLGKSLPEHKPVYFMDR